MFEPGTDVVKELSLAYGGMAPTTVMAKTTMKSLIGKYENCIFVYRFLPVYQMNYLCVIYVLNYYLPLSIDMYSFLSH